MPEMAEEALQELKRVTLEDVLGNPIDAITSLPSVTSGRSPREIADEIKLKFQPEAATYALAALKVATAKADGATRPDVLKIHEQGLSFLAHVCEGAREGGKILSTAEISRRLRMAFIVNPTSEQQKIEAIAALSLVDTVNRPDLITQTIRDARSFGIIAPPNVEEA